MRKHAITGAFLATWALLALSTPTALGGTTGSLLSSRNDGPTTETPPTNTVRTAPFLSLLGQSPIISDTTNNANFRLEMSVEPSTVPVPANLGVTVSVHRKARNRTDFRASLQGQDLGPILGLVPQVPVPEGAAPTVTVDLTFGPVTDQCPQCIALKDDGVYPINVELRDRATQDVLDRFVTHAIKSTPTTVPKSRTKVALVVPLNLPPARQPDGSINLRTTREFIQLIEGINARPLVPLTIAPTPETIEALANNPEDQLLGLLRQSLPGREVLGGTYTRWPTNALEQPSLASEWKRQQTLGDAVLRQQLQTEPLPGVRLAGDRVPNARTLAAGAITTMVLEPAQVAPSIGAIRPAGGPVLYDPGASTGETEPAITSLLLDGAIEADLATPGDPLRKGGNNVLRAQHVLADLAVISGPDAPGLAIQIPENTPQATLDALLAGLGTTNPIVEPVTLSELLRVPLQQQNDTPVVVGAKAAEPNAPTGSTFTAADANDIAKLRIRLDAYGSLFTSSPPHLANHARRLAITTAADLDQSTRRAHLASLTNSINQLLAKVHLATPERITVTARNAEVPIAIINDTGSPIRVALVVRSSSLQLRDAAVTVDAIGTTESRQIIDVAGPVGKAIIPVETRGPGSFSLIAKLTTETGVDLAIERFQVRSTAISGLGSALTIGSLLVLLAWWIRWGRAARRRAPKRHPAQLAANSHTVPRTKP